MRTLKKSLSLVLVLAMVFSFCAMGTSAAFVDADEISADYVEAVEVMNDLAILQGSEGSFDPQGTLNRAAAARIIVAMHKAEAYAKTATCTFTDVAVDDWFYDEIAYCQSIGIMKGYGDGTVGPLDELTGPQFALMVMKAAGVDTKSVDPAAFELSVTTLAVKEKLATVEELSAETFTREMAAQMAFNGMNYVTEATYGYAMWKDDDSDGVIDTAEKSTVKYYTTVADAAAAANALSTPWTYAVAATPVSINSLLKENYKILRDADDVDGYKRPATSYTNLETGDVAYYVDAADYVLEGKITQKALYATLGAKVAETYTLKANTNGDVLAADVGALSKTSTSAVNSTDLGMVSYIYVDHDNDVVNIHTVDSFFGTVTKVTAADEVGNPRFITIDGTYTVVTEDFAKGDKVIYTLGNTDATATVESVELAGVVSGTLTKHTTGTATIYYIDGEPYQVSANGSTAYTSANVGYPMAVYVDNFGHIVGDVSSAPTATKYIHVLANKASVTDVLSGATVTEVYGVLSDGTYGWFTTTASGTAANALCTSTTSDLYVYTVNGAGQLVLGTNVDAAYGSAIAKNDTTAGSDILNSSTVFHFIQKNLAGEIVAVVTKIGNANIGAGVAANKGWIAAEDGVVKYVFVEAKYSDGISLTSDMVYVPGLTPTTSVDEDTTTYIHVAFDLEGNPTTIVEGSAGTLTEGMYLINSDGSSTVVTIAKLTVDAVAGNVVTLSDGNSYNVVDGTEQYFFGDDTEIKVGQQIFMIANNIVSTNLDYVFVVADQVAIPAVVAVSGATGTCTVEAVVALGNGSFVVTCTGSAGDFTSKTASDVTVDDENSSGLYVDAVTVNADGSKMTIVVTYTDIPANAAVAGGATTTALDITVTVS